MKSSPSITTGALKQAARGFARMTHQHDTSKAKGEAMVRRSLLMWIGAVDHSNYIPLELGALGAALDLRAQVSDALILDMLHGAESRAIRDIAAGRNSVLSTVDATIAVGMIPPGVFGFRPGARLRRASTVLAQIDAHLPGMTFAPLTLHAFAQWWLAEDLGNAQIAIDTALSRNSQFPLARIVYGLLQTNIQPAWTTRSHTA